MAVETPDVIHALATIGLVDTVPTLLKSAMIDEFILDDVGTYVLRLQYPINPQHACVNVTGRNGYAPSFTYEVDSDGSEIIVYAVGGDGALWSVPCDITIMRIPPANDDEISEDDGLDPPSNSEGGGAPPSGAAGGQLGGTYPDPIVVGATVLQSAVPFAATWGEIGDGQAVRLQSGVFEGYTPPLPAGVKVIAFGQVNLDGSIASGFGFTVTKGSAGNYQLNIGTFAAEDTVLVTPISDDGASMAWYARSLSGPGDCRINTIIAVAADSAFCFQVLQNS